MEFVPIAVLALVMGLRGARAERRTYTAAALAAVGTAAVLYLYR